MSNGLGAGFFALTLLAVLGGVSLLVDALTGVAYAFRRRTGRVPAPFAYLLALAGVAVLAVAGFVLLAMYDEAPVVAWLFSPTVLVPLLAVGGYLDRTTDLGRVEVVAATVAAWGVAYLPGVVVAVGAMTGIDSVLGLAPAESRAMGVAWGASVVGGAVVVIPMVALVGRLGRLFRSSSPSAG